MSDLRQTHTVTGSDGTAIGWVQRGRGPVMVLVHGATADHTRWATVEAQLAARFTLVLMDRRGRGLSAAEAPGPYDLEREAADVRAVIAAAAGLQGGAPIYLFGHSYGGLCVLDAVAGDPDTAAKVAKLLVYEPAFATPGYPVIGPEALKTLVERVDAGDADAALDYFFVTIIGVDPAVVAAMKQMPGWDQRRAAVHTLAREGAAANVWKPARIAALPMPLRILVGEISPAWLRAASFAAHNAAPHSTIVELPGQAHGAMDSAPRLFIDEVARFWTEE